MDIRNCKRCKRLFNYTDNSKYCPACMEAIEQEFHEAKEYIYKHPGVNIHDVSEALEIEIGQIKQWIREERLTLSSATDGAITCENCGVNITTGRYCENCKKQLTNDLSKAIVRKPEPVVKKERKSEKDRMRFLDNK